MYIAYEMMRDAQGRLFRRIYGRGLTAEDAIFNARHEVRGGQVWERQYAPNISNLTTAEVDNENQADES